MGSDGVLREVQWLEANIADASIVNAIELKNTVFLNQFGDSQVGNLVLIKLRNNTWRVFSGVRGRLNSTLDDVIRLFDKTNSLNSININGKILPDISHKLPSQTNRFSVKIFESASDIEVRQLAENLAGKALTEVRTGSVWTATAADGTKINLRNVSTSEPVTKAKWTIDVINESKIGPLKVGNEKKVELKFR